VGEGNKDYIRGQHMEANPYAAPAAAIDDVAAWDAQIWRIARAAAASVWARPYWTA
jgi:hypothetical protein